MVMARINIGWEFRCIPVDGEPWCGCRWPNTEESASVEIQTENEDFAAKIDNLEEWEEEVTERLGEVYSECIQKHKHVLTLYEYGLLCQYTGEYQKSARLISEYIEATKKSLKKTSSPTPEKTTSVSVLHINTHANMTRQSKR